MKVTKQIILIGAVALLTGFATLMLRVENKTKRKSDKINPVVSSKEKEEKDTPKPDEEDYYRAHPYLKKAEEMNNADLYDSAIYYYQVAASKFEKEAEWRGYVWATNYVSKLYLFVYKQNYLNSLPFLKSAIAKERVIGANHPFIATTLFYWGLYYYNEKQTVQALKMYQRSLVIGIKNFGEQHLAVADIYNAIGDVHFYLLYNGQAAEQNYAKSLRIKEAVAGKTEPSLIYSYYNLLNLNILIGDYAEAESYGYKALQSLNHVKNNQIYWSELLQGVMANIYVEQNKPKKAIPKLYNAISLNSKNKGDKAYLSFYYNSLGEVYSRIAKYDSAVVYFNKALALSEKGSGYRIQANETAYSNFNLGSTYLKLNRHNIALNYLKRCLAIRLKIYGNNHIETAVAYQHLATAYQKSGFPDSSLVYLQKALLACTKNFNSQDILSVPFVSNINSNYSSFQILKDKAAVLKNLYTKEPTQTKLLNTALKYYHLTDSLLTNFRSEYDRESSKLNYFKNNNDIYAGAIDCATLLYQKTGDTIYLDFVFQFIDKRKSSLLLEALHKQDKLKELGIPPKEYAAQLEIQQDLMFLQGRLEEENIKENPEEATLRLLHTKIYATENKLKANQDKLNKRFLFPTNQENKSDTIRLADIQSYSSQNNTLFLEYFWGDSATYIIGIYKDKKALVKIANIKLLETQVYTLLRHLEKGYQVTTSGPDFTKFQESSFYIFNSLVKPIFIQFGLDGLEKETRPKLIVIPDGLISFVPFEILISKLSGSQEADYRKLNYLVKDYVMSYDYSGRLLLKNYYRQTPVQNSRVLAFSYSKNNPTQLNPVGQNSKRSNLNAELPGSAQELTAISSYMNGKFYTGEAATEDVFKQEAHQYDILHLAVHGEANPNNTFNAKLIFKQNKHNINDGNLNLYELQGLKMKARLAVLSACESGLGKYNVGEGVYSMARGFINAGCNAVVMSYWQVNDNSTAAIMANFYKALAAGSSIDTSIRMAKLAYLQNADRRTAHPANWAAFVAMGNMEPVTKSDFSEKILYCACCILILLIAAYWWKTKSKPVKQVLKAKYPN